MSLVSTPDLSVIVATLNNDATLARTLSAVNEARGASNVEIVVADGGSSDGTLTAAEAAGAKVVAAQPGYGRQLALGAKAARGKWFLFLDPDTQLEPYWSTVAAAHMGVRSNMLRAAYFRLAFEDAASGAQRDVQRVNWRARRLGLPYADQGLLISRMLYESRGGYTDVEDAHVDLLRRLGRDAIDELAASVVTTPARHADDNPFVAPVKRFAMMALDSIGVSPTVLARLYG